MQSFASILDSREVRDTAGDPVGGAELTADEIAILTSESSEEQLWSRYAGSTSKGCC